MPGRRYADLCGWCGTALAAQTDVEWRAMRSREGVFFAANYCPSPRSCKAQGAAEPARVVARLRRELEHLDRESVDAPA